MNAPSSNSTSGLDLLLAFAGLFRLRTALLAALAGCATLYALNSSLPLGQYLLTAILLAGMTAAACAINDYWDLDKDRINHPDRVLPSGRLSLQQAWWAALVLFACAVIAAIPLGLYPFLLVAFSTVLLWNYSHLLDYSGILGNAIVAAIVAALIFLGSLVAGRTLAMLYPLWFLFCYTFAKEIIWDIHDVQGDRRRGVVTVANRWGERTAFLISWGLIAALISSIPVALLFLPMVHPLWFAIFSSMMLLSFGAVLARYQQRRSAAAYGALIAWERLSMLFGVIGLLGTAPPL